MRDFGSFFIRAICGFSVFMAASCCFVTLSWLVAAARAPAF
jgi:hypothetical protein